MNLLSKSKLFLFFFFLISLSISAQDSKALEGRWDILISKDDSQLPSWLEVRHSGHKTLVGRFVYAFGSARPIAEIKTAGNKFSFTIPPQWEGGEGNMEFNGQFADDKLSGSMRYTDGKIYKWIASRAPVLNSHKDVTWGTPINLFNNRNLDGWHASGENQWTAEKGVLTSKESGSNLISDKKFTDFKLHIEFRYPEDGNSGVYLRGRYEVQVADSKGDEPSDILFGGIYGFLTPNRMVAKAAGEWQSYDITLIGRKVTVVANGHTIISEQLIPGITGGALDCDEGAPGPIMIQGDHGPVEYRNIVITPVVERSSRD